MIAIAVTTRFIKQKQKTKKRRKVVLSTRPKTPFFSLCTVERIRNVKIENLKSTRIGQYTIYTNQSLLSTSIDFFILQTFQTCLPCGPKRWLRRSWKPNLIPYSLAARSGVFATPANLNLRNAAVRVGIGMRIGP